MGLTLTLQFNNFYKKIVIYGPCFENMQPFKMYHITITSNGRHKSHKFWKSKPNPGGIPLRH